MNKEEIKDYLKRVDDLEVRLTGEDKETFAWLIYGYNECAKLLNETEQQVKKQEEVINKATEYINTKFAAQGGFTSYELNDLLTNILSILGGEKK